MQTTGEVPSWQHWMWLMFGLMFAGVFVYDFDILGHGTGTSAKVFSFVIGWLSGSSITTAWCYMRQRKR